MSLSRPTTSSSNLQAIFDTALKEYQRKTKKDLSTHPLMSQLETCNSPSDILNVLHTQRSGSTSSDERLTKWLSPTVNVLSTFSATLGGGVGLTFAPAKAIFTGIGVLLSATKDVPSQDGLIEIFECIENFFRRLESYVAEPMTGAMTDIVVKIMAEVLGILGLVTKEMKRGRTEKYFRKLMGRRDIKDALRRLDRLTQEEARMLAVQVLQVTRNAGTRVETVNDQVARVNDLVLQIEDTKALVQQTASNIDEGSPYARPIRPQVFFGRNDELNTIIDLVFSSPSPARIAILGPGGVGKTALALAVLTHEKVMSRFGDSRYLVKCESLMSRNALLAAIANSISALQHGTTPDGHSVRLESHVFSALGSEECILCLDSFESSWDQPGPSRRDVEALLADITAQSSVTVLITMRGVERPKETAWTRPMLPPLTNFPRDAAKNTWESLAGTCDEWAEKLIEAVHCLPLAVTILGGLAEASTAETLWERWQTENIALIEKEKGDKLASLEFSISLSFKGNRMAADGFSKRLLGVLSLLPDGMPAFASPEFRRLFPDIPDISRSLDTLLKCSLATRTSDKRVRVNSLIRHYCERNDIIAPEDRRALASHGYYNADHEPSETMSSVPNPDQHSKSSMPPSPTTPTSPPTASSGRPRSFGMREPSPVRGADANATQPIVSITPAALQSTTEASAHPRAPSLRGSTSPAINAAALSPFASRNPSRSPSPAGFLEHGSLESDSDSVITQAERYSHTRSRAIEAITGFVDTAANIGYEALSTGVDLLQFAPVPGLQLAGNILLNIRAAVGVVKTNRVASLRLTERCDEIWISIRDEIARTGNTVTEELREPIAKLVKAFRGVQDLLKRLGQRPFLKRYLGRDEIQSSIAACDIDLSDALRMFHLSIQIRSLNLSQANELRRQKETHDILESLSHLSPCLPPVHPPLSPVALQSSPVDPESVHLTRHTLCAAQNSQDRARDSADLRQLMRTALDANDDLAMFEVFQIARSEMPEAIKTLERARERVVEGGHLYTEESTTTALPSPQQEEAGKGNDPSVELSDKSQSQSSADTLDREFIETGIDALRRLSKCTDLSLPNWTITRYEIELEEKVGFGSFSYVYRGSWCKNTVAIKVLDETTPRKVFLREVEIWKALYHPNIVQLFGASSASGEPPWFLVSTYYPRGSLVKHLKGLSDADAANVDALKMTHEISEGMAYLHKKGVRHGDLKATNILVDDDTCCVISDFGQSEMKSEVYRMTHARQPRGTLRWQAPELMQGTETLTPEIDVYAFAICCVEILTMGALPWPRLDDDTVRHLVLDEDKRPLLPPPSNLVDAQLMDIICTSWDRVSSNRPSFEQIASEVKKLRAVRSAQNIDSTDV